jgi:hypothetical protein
MTREPWFGSPKAWAQDFAATGAVGAFLGLLGPFGSFYNGPAWQRVAFWLAMVWAGTAVYGLAVRWWLARAPSRLAAWIGLGLIVVALSAPFSVWSWIVATWVWPGLRRLPQLTPAVWYAQGVITTLPFVAGFAILTDRRRGASALRSPPASADLLGAAPAEVLCLQMEDHYVRIHTRAGSRLVLATLAQAIEALGRAPGLQVHRSWWVAEKAVSGAEAEGRNLRLVLVNGLKAPVARSSVAAVRAAGWLERRAA